MKIVQQPQKLAIENVDARVENDDEKKHGPLLPNSIRCFVCVPSNCGKTNVVFNMFFDANGLCFQNLYVFSKSLFQPKYRMLNDIMKSLSDSIGYFTYSENDEVPPRHETAPNSIVLFNDVPCERQNNIRKYFTMGRHSGVDTLYLCQTYSQVPKQLIRDNENLLILFRRDDLNLRHVYNNHINTETFKDVCGEAWKTRYGFLVVNKDCPMNAGRYRVGFDRYVTL